MSEHQIRGADDRAELGVERVHVNAATLVGKPATILPMTEEHVRNFTESVFEDALDRVSRREDEIDAADALKALSEEGETP